MRKSIIEWVIAIIIGITLAILLSQFVVTKYDVNGNSMYPTLKNEDKLLINEFSKYVGTVKRGDIVVFHADHEHDFIKRLIGKPGDTVRYKRDQLFINGKKVSEPYLKYNKKVTLRKYLTEDTDVSNMRHSRGKHHVPRGKYLVLGDNRDISNDNRRDLGLVNEDRLVGKVFMRYAPISKMKFKTYAHSFDKVN
ncbi:signal peptidase I [Staphylococcus sp. SQ8-PEA]|uniref:Signal peptidase I n=1 Tax=Staphylococcus marylandisciuri TaxID=2981529 RepID=A0ABT2QRN8_9STAP|nr:signal peptidase I [Staphylococcus marylandisciuri]MCU5746644.1 signal peptidase I [Staphylococcus marylandisciuri]